jgi:hypothetical protein
MRFSISPSREEMITHLHSLSGLQTPSSLNSPSYCWRLILASRSTSANARTGKRSGVPCATSCTTQLGGSGLYAEAVKGCLFLHNKNLSRPNDEDPRVFLRRIIRQEVVSKLEMALNAPTASSGKRRREESDDGPTPHNRTGNNGHVEPSTGPLLPIGSSSHPSKRQRIDLAEQRSREGQRDADPLPQPLPATNEPSAR